MDVLVAEKRKMITPVGRMVVFFSLIIIAVYGYLYALRGPSLAQVWTQGINIAALALLAIGQSMTKIYEFEYRKGFKDNIKLYYVIDTIGLLIILSGLCIGYFEERFAHDVEQRFLFFYACVSAVALGMIWRVLSLHIYGKIFGLKTLNRG